MQDVQDNAKPSDYKFKNWCPTRIQRVIECFESLEFDPVQFVERQQFDPIQFVERQQFDPAQFVERQPNCSEYRGVLLR